MTDVAKALAGITPKKREQLHVSGINMLSDCGMRFYYRYILGIRRPPKSFMHIGTAVDISVAQDLQHKIDTGELMKRDEVLDVAATTFEQREARDPFEPDPEHKGVPREQLAAEAKDKSVNLAGLHYDKAAPLIAVKHVQRGFALNMDKWMRQRAKQMHQAAEVEQDDYRSKLLRSEAKALNAAARIGMDCAGEQDVVEYKLAAGSDSSENHSLASGDQLVIRDTKTSGKQPVKSLMDGNTKPGIADDSDQLTTYAMASLVLDGKLPDLMVLDYLIQTPARHELKYVPTKTVRDMNDVNVFLNRFANAIHAYKRGVFVPAKADWWGCSETYCGYWEMCPYSKKPKLIQISQPLGAE